MSLRRKWILVLHTWTGDDIGIVESSFAQCVWFATTKEARIVITAFIITVWIWAQSFAL